MARRSAFPFQYKNDFGQVREHDVRFEGVVHNLQRRYLETNSENVGSRLKTI